jgi:Gpi18-like mannosyltransferase
MKKIFLVFFVWVITIYAFTFLSSTPAFFDYSYESTSMIKENIPSIRHLLNFDGSHYQNIAHFGYIKKFQTAFFPLFPIMINFVSFMTQSHLISALLISLLCTYLSVLVIVKLFKKPTAAIILIFFPLSFFFLAGYTESLFLFLSLLSWHFFKEKKYLLSGALGFLTSLSRFYGILLFPSLLLEFFLKLPKNKRLKLISYKPVVPLLLIPLGLGSYMVYLQLIYQDPLAFFTALSLWGKSTITFPLQTIYRYFKIITTVSPTIIQYWVALLEILSLVVGLLASLILYKQKQFSYSLYVFLGSIIPSFTGTLQSLPRYLLVLFPIYFIKLPVKLHFPILAASFTLQLVLLTAFLTGHFIA